MSCTISKGKGKDKDRQFV